MRNAESVISHCRELACVSVYLRIHKLHLCMATTASACLLVGDLALLVDTSHPMIRPGLEKGIDAARKIMQTGRGFCLQVDTLLL